MSNRERRERKWFRVFDYRFNHPCGNRAFYCFTKLQAVEYYVNRIINRPGDVSKYYAEEVKGKHSLEIVRPPAPEAQPKPANQPTPIVPHIEHPVENPSEQQTELF